MREMGTGPCDRFWININKQLPEPYSASYVWCENYTHPFVVHRDNYGKWYLNTTEGPNLELSQDDVDAIKYYIPYEKLAKYIKPPMV